MPITRPAGPKTGAARAALPTRRVTDDLVWLQLHYVSLRRHGFDQVALRQVFNQRPGTFSIPLLQLLRLGFRQGRDQPLCASRIPHHQHGLADLRGLDVALEREYR